MRTFAAIKRRDPKIYQKDIKFYEQEEDDDEEEDEGNYQMGCNKHMCVAPQSKTFDLFLQIHQMQEKVQVKRNKSQCFSKIMTERFYWRKAGMKIIKIVIDFKFDMNHVMYDFHIIIVKIILE